MDLSFFTWETLATVGGATAVVTLLIAVLNKLFPELSERARNAVIAVTSIALIEAGAISAGDVTWQTYVLAGINGLVVSLAVLRLSDVTVPRLINRSKGEPVQYTR